MSTQRLLHVAIADDWEASERFGEHEVSTRRTTLEELGYLHAATAAQLGPVLEEVYGDLDLPLVLVVVDEDALSQTGVQIRWEVSAHPSGRFGTVPRIMGALPMEAPVVAAEIPLHRTGHHWDVPDLSGLRVRETAPDS